MSVSEQARRIVYGGMQHTDLDSDVTHASSIQSIQNLEEYDFDTSDMTDASESIQSADESDEPDEADNAGKSASNQASASTDVSSDSDDPSRGDARFHSNKQTRNITHAAGSNDYNSSCVHFRLKWTCTMQCQRPAYKTKLARTKCRLQGK
jgi:hypothetical protein